MFPNDCAVEGVGESQTRATLHALRSITAAQLLRALIWLAFLMDARRLIVIAIAKAGGVSWEVFDVLDYIGLSEWAAILAATVNADLRLLRLRRRWFVPVIVFAVFALLLVQPRSHVFTAALCLMIAGVLATMRPTRGLAVCLVIIGLQFSIDRSSGPFVWSAGLDTVVAQGALRVAGFPAVIDGLALGLRDSQHSILVGPMCSTLCALSDVVPAYLVFAWARREAPRGPVARRLLGAMAFVVAINLLRLCAMALDPAFYAFFHEGIGGEVVAMLFAVIAFRAAEAPAPRVNSTPTSAQDVEVSVAGAL